MNHEVKFAMCSVHDFAVLSGEEAACPECAAAEGAKHHMPPMQHRPVSLLEDAASIRSPATFVAAGGSGVFTKVAGSHTIGPVCACATCTPNTIESARMVLCPTCGNKRCPHATHHIYSCTGSNAPGQLGSSY